jgi:glutamate synthase (NADPH/NADH) small chain
VVICSGATIPRDLPIPGRELDGIHFAMDFLTRQNLSNAGDDPATMGLAPILAAGKHVVVIGGGDTGSDCIGTSIRQKAKSVTNFELFPRPPANRSDHQPWPFWPVKLRTSSSHEEGCERQWGILTKKFVGEGNRVVKLITVDVEFVTNSQGRTQMREVPETRREWPADLVLLALGFSGPDPNTIVKSLGLALDERGNIQTGKNYMTGIPGVFAAGDAHRGQSLIVWAISEGREAARNVDAYLMGTSVLPVKGGGDLPKI